MKLNRVLAGAVVAVVCVFAIEGIAGAGAGGSASKPIAAEKTLKASLKFSHSSTKSKAGWQGVESFDTGVSPDYYTLEITGTCPTGLIAQNGAYIVSSNTDPSFFTIQLMGDGPFPDVTPAYSEWIWVFTWLGGASVAPPNSTLDFNLYCGKP